METELLSARYETCYIPLDKALFPDTFQSLYRPLSVERKEIRLLVLEPGSFDDPLYCWIRHAESGGEDLPYYETISYCWGESCYRGWLSVNRTIVSVPISAVHALRRMRLKEVPRMLWIDAVCINQTDLLEKNSQMTLMSDIYRLGARNLIFLGEDPEQRAEDVGRALKDLGTWYQQLCYGFTEEEHSKYWNGIYWDVPRNLWLHHLEYLNSLYTRVFPFFELSWFRRLWVVQEVELSSANLFIWGSSEYTSADVRLVLVATYGLFHDRFRLPHIYTEDSGLCFNPFLENSYMVSMCGRPFSDASSAATNSLEYLLKHIVSHKLASDSRDYVFGVLAFFQRKNRLRSTPDLLKPDYSKSVAEVFRDATRYVLKTQPLASGRTVLELVYHEDNPALQLSRLPSWAIRWDRQRRLGEDNSVVLAYHELSSHEDEGFGERLRSTLTEGSFTHPDRLTLSGFLLGRVSKCATRIASASEGYPASTRVPDEHLNLILSILLDHSSGKCTLAYDGDIDDIVAQIMLPWWSFSPEKSTFSNTKSEILRALISCISTGQFPTHPSLLADVPESLALDTVKFFDLFEKVTRSQSFFSTDAGHIGIGSTFLRIGDIVAMFEGEHMPFILRPFGHEYGMMGMAYIYGLSRKEVARMGLSPEWIDLR